MRLSDPNFWRTGPLTATSFFSEMGRNELKVTGKFRRSRLNRKNYVNFDAVTFDPNFLKIVNTDFDQTLSIDGDL